MLDVEDVPPLPCPQQTAPDRPLLVRSVFAVEPGWPLRQAAVATAAVAVTLFGVSLWYDAV
jgi:hypothetical protein